MAEEFQVVEKAFGPVIEIEECVSVWRMPSTFRRDYQQIGDYLAAQGAECNGLPYGRYQDMDWESELKRGKLATLFAMLIKKWRFYVGMPTSKPIATEGEMKSRVLDNRHYVHGIHRGPYQECSATYKALFNWAGAQGLTLQNEAIECYVNDPNEVDKADIETEIYIPVIKD